jgi:hypothetical protein
MDSPLAAKLNAFLGGGFLDFAILNNLKKEYGISEPVVKMVEEIARAGLLLNIKPFNIFNDYRSIFFCRRNWGLPLKMQTSNSYGYGHWVWCLEEFYNLSIICILKFFILTIIPTNLMPIRE